MILRMLEKHRWQRATQLVPRLLSDPAAPAYHGQYHQDRFVAEFLDQQTGGFFVDIGANDGISFSNTYYFEKNLNWSGLAFEPHPDVYRRLASVRTCTTINAGVGPHNAILKFSCVNAGAAMLSGFTDTFNNSHRRRCQREVRKAGTTIREIDVPTVKLSAVMAEQQRSVIDYLSLDTEGGEFEILRSIDFDQLHVRCLSVENNSKSLAVHTYLIGKNYRLMAIAGCDEIYVHQSDLQHKRVA